MAKNLRCPICGKGVAFEDKYMPFCSDRCRVLDLANWADEKYRISGPAGRNELEELDEPETPESLIQ